MTRVTPIRLFAISLALSFSAAAPNLRADSLIDKIGAAQNQAASINAGDVTVVINPPKLSGAPGQVIEVSADFKIPSGWHIYGKPLPEGFTPTAIALQSDAIAAQSFTFPKPEMVTFAAEGQTMPVYKDTVRANGKLKVRPDIKPGTYDVIARVELQECNDAICKMPKSASATLALVIKPAH